MHLAKRLSMRFSLDFSKLSSNVTQTGIRNLTIKGKEREVQGYKTSNFENQNANQTVIMIH